MTIISPLPADRDGAFAEALVLANLPGRPDPGYALPDGFDREWVAALLENLLVDEPRLAAYVEAVRLAAERHGVWTHLLRTRPRFTEAEDREVAAGGFRGVQDNGRLAALAIATGHLVGLAESFLLDEDEWEGRLGDWYWQTELAAADRDAQDV